jgi:mannose-6-phosphate isomerase-like protein (cupin superfamily)
MTSQQRTPPPGPKEIENGGAVNPRTHTLYKDEYADSVSLYRDEGNSAVIWCLKAGQENSLQYHDTIAHVFFVIEGNGHYMKGEPGMADVEAPRETSANSKFSPKMIPIKSGDVIFIPKKTIHGIKNTGSQNLAYVAVNVGEGYQRIDVGPQSRPHR